MKLSWRKIVMGPVIFHEPKNSHSLLYKLRIKETNKSKSVIVELNLKVAPKNFQFSTTGPTTVNTDLNTGNLVFTSEMPEGRNIRETKRKAKNWHEQLLKYEGI
jgi:hypothetical protein